MRAFCKEKVKNPTPNPFLTWRTPQGARPALLWHVMGALSKNPAFPTDTMDFSGMSLIKLKKEEMETQVQPWGGFSEATDEPSPAMGVPLSPARVPGWFFGHR